MTESDAEKLEKHTTTYVLPPRSRVFLPMPLAERLKGLVWWFTRLFLFRPSYILGNRWRRLLLRCFGASIGKQVQVEPSVVVDFPWNLAIGDNTTIGRNVILNCMGTIEIGRDVRISQFAHMCAGTHRYERRDMLIERSPIMIADRVWIAADSFVGPGVEIGHDTVLAARASAFGNLQSGFVYMGEPARPYKPR